MNKKINLLLFQNKKVVFSELNVDKVTINVTYKCVELPNGFDTEENLIFVTDVAYLINEGTNTVTDNKINILDINYGGQNESEIN